MSFMAEKIDDKVCLPAFEDQVNRDFREIFSEPFGLEAKSKKCVVETGSSDMSVLLTNPFENGAEQNAPALRDPHIRTIPIVALSLSVDSFLSRDTDRPFSIKNPSEISSLQFGEHDFSFMACSMQYMPFQGTSHA